MGDPEIGGRARAGKGALPWPLQLEVRCVAKSLQSPSPRASAGLGVWEWALEVKFQFGGAPRVAPYFVRPGAFFALGRPVEAGGRDGRFLARSPGEPCGSGWKGGLGTRGSLGGGCLRLVNSLSFPLVAHFLITPTPQIYYIFYALFNFRFGGWPIPNTSFYPQENTVT